MPIQIQPRRKEVTVQSGRSGGGGLGQIIGAAAGGIAGGMAGIPGGPAGIAAGAIGGASGGAGLGQAIGEGLKRSRPEITQEVYERQVTLPAAEEAIRGQQLLESVKATQNYPELQQYASQLTQGYIQSMINLKRMG